MTRRSRERPSADRILVAAERLFSERGYAEPSLRDLLDAAACSTTAFYARFPTKEAVLRRLVDDLLEQLLTRAGQALARATSVPHGFELGLDALVAALEDRRGLVRVALTAEEGDTRRLLHERYRALAGLLARELVGIGQADAQPRAWAIVGALELTVRRWAVFDEIPTRALRAELGAVAATLLPPTLPRE